MPYIYKFYKIIIMYSIETINNTPKLCQFTTFLHIILPYQGKTIEITAERNFLLQMIYKNIPTIRTSSTIKENGLINIFPYFNNFIKPQRITLYPNRSPWTNVPNHFPYSFPNPPINIVYRIKLHYHVSDIYIYIVDLIIL